MKRQDAISSLHTGSGMAGRGAGTAVMNLRPGLGMYERGSCPPALSLPELLLGLSRPTQPALAPASYYYWLLEGSHVLI